MAVYMPETTYKLRQLLLFHSPSVRVNIYGLCANVGVRIGKYALRLSVENDIVVAPTAPYHPLVPPLDEAEEKLVPLQFQRHSVEIVHLNDVVAHKQPDMAQYLPHHLQPAQLTPAHVAAHVYVTRTVSHTPGRHQRHLVSQLLKAPPQSTLHKTRLAQQQYLHDAKTVKINPTSVPATSVVSEKKMSTCRKTSVQMDNIF